MKRKKFCSQRNCLKQQSNQCCAEAQCSTINLNRKQTFSSTRPKYNDGQSTTVRSKLRDAGISGVTTLKMTRIKYIPQLNSKFSFCARPISFYWYRSIRFSYWLIPITDNQFPYQFSISARLLIWQFLSADTDTNKLLPYWPGDNRYIYQLSVCTLLV